MPKLTVDTISTFTTKLNDSYFIEEKEAKTEKNSEKCKVCLVNFVGARFSSVTLSVQGFQLLPCLSPTLPRNLTQDLRHPLKQMNQYGSSTPERTTKKKSTS